MGDSENKPASRRYLAVGILSAVTLTAATMWLAFALLKPTPPRTVAMATDPAGSFNAELGKRYRDLLAKDGVDLKLVPTAGSVESLARLRDPRSGISIAILPSGLSNDQNPGDLVSLGTLFYEPLWVFTRGMQIGGRERLHNRRISIGPEGSGTHALSIEFLARVGIIDKQSATLLPLTPQDTAEKLLHGEIDVGVLLDPWESPAVRELLSAQDTRLESVRRADAFVALYPYLNKLVLPAGVADMARDRPPTDVVLLAPMASLVVRESLHPAIQYLLLEAAAEIHSEPGLWRSADQFPAAEAIDFPLSAQARHFYKSGSPFLQQHLPFWLSVLVQQILVALIPIVGMLYPLVRFAPVLFAWTMRRRVYKLYDELRQLEEEVGSASADRKNTESVVLRLNRLEDRTTHFRIPMSFEPLVYQLRSHIKLVRERLGRS